jgi:isocitrate dehydrogenase (NAD+)
MMLKHLGERPAASSIESALEKVYRDGKQVTRDVGGTAGTKQFTDAVISALTPVPASR